MEEEIKQFYELTNPFDPIDFMIFKDEIKDEFNTIYSKIFQNNKDKKALVISKLLFNRFFYIFPFQELEKKGFLIYYFENCPQLIKEFQILFVIPPKTECIDIVLKQMLKDEKTIGEMQKNIQVNNNQNQIQENQNNIIAKNYYFLYVPKVDISILNYLKEKDTIYEGNFGNYYDFEMLNYPLDYDLISFEDKQCFKELFLYKFSDCVDNLANLLIKIQDIFGKIKYKYIIGENSKIVSELLDKKEKEGFLSDKNSDEILACFFLDRSVDYITPLCSEFTYEALLNNYFGINFNKIKVKNEIAKIKKEEKKKDEKAKQQEKEMTDKEREEKIKEDIEKERKEREEIKNVNIGYNDLLFQMIKTFNFSKVGVFLAKRFEYQDQSFRSIKNDPSQKYDSEKINNELILIRKMNLERPQLKLHNNLADYIRSFTSLPQSRRRLQLEQTLLEGNKECLDLIRDYYDTEMAKKGDPYELLKLFCLENLVFGGVKGKLYDSFKNDFLMTYDENLFFLIKNLEELKIINKDGKNKLYQILLEKLNLINFDVKINNPDDTSYVFGGYSPISIRFIEKAIKVGWNSLLKDVFKNLGMEYEFPNDEREVMNPSKEKNFILLVYTGGITYSEIEAVRYLNKSPEFSKYKFLIITTNIINGKSFFDEIKNDKIDLMIDESAIAKDQEEKAEILDKKTLEKLKKKEKEEQKKKDKEEREKQKAIAKQEKELAKERAEYKKMKEKESKKK